MVSVLKTERKFLKRPTLLEVDATSVVVCGNIRLLVVRVMKLGDVHAERIPFMTIDVLKERVLIRGFHVVAVDSPDALHIAFDEHQIHIGEASELVARSNVVRGESVYHVKRVDIFGFLLLGNPVAAFAATAERHQQQSH